MRIALIGIYPFYEESGLALPYLKAYALEDPYLSQRIEIKIFHFNTDIPYRNVIKEIKKYEPEMVGFSCYIWNISKILKICQELKKEAPSIIIILGGPQVTDLSNYILLKHPYVDIVVRGEGEAIFRSVIKNLYQKNNLKDVDGITYRINGKIYFNPDHHLVYDLSDIPSPYLKNYIDLDKTKIIHWETSRGCFYNCAFCTFGGTKKIRFFPIGRIENEIALMKRKMVKKVFCIDCAINFNKQRAMLLLQTLIEHNFNIPIQFEIHSDFLDEDIAELLSKLNIDILGIGLQSINPVSLEYMKRRFSEKVFSRKIALLAKHKIPFFLSIIYGLPGDNINTYKETIDYALSLRPAWINFYPLLLLPGSYFTRNRNKYKFKTSKRSKLFSNCYAPDRVLSCNTFSKNELKRAERLSIKLWLLFKNREMLNMLYRLDSNLNHTNLLKIYEDFISSLRNRVNIEALYNKLKIGFGFEQRISHYFVKFILERKEFKMSKKLFPRKNSDVASQVSKHKTNLLLQNGTNAKNISDLFILNPTAVCIWKAINGKRSIDEISAMLCNKYNVEPEKAKNQTTKFILSLKKKGLIDL